MARSSAVRALSQLKLGRTGCALTHDAARIEQIDTPARSANTDFTELPSQIANGGGRYARYCPPLAVSVEPVIRPASSEARNTTQRAISSGSPRRLIGISGRMLFSSTSFGTACTISVLM